MLKILASDGMEAAAIADLQAKGHTVDQQFFDADVLGAKLAEYDVLVVRSATKVRKPIIDEAKAGGKLKLVIRGGVGVDNIDVAYAEEQGIAVRNTPKASSASVAELALGHMFALARFIGIANVTMKDGQWNKKHYEGIELSGKTLGFIGMGRIAQELAKRAEALGMTVIYNDLFEIKGLPASYTSMSREDVLKNADFVTLHIPMPEDKQPVIQGEQLAMMKPTAFIINTARGGLICEEGLCEALDNGVIAGAALDVFAEEPTKNERVMKHPKISLTPHIGGSTAEAQNRIGAEIVDIITGFFG
jgi:Phosphoglycerate dehydrogenase and related dehydrogenases